MAQQRPPTPPPFGADLQYGFHSLVQHNANTPYPHMGGGYADSPYVDPVHFSPSFMSPMPTMQDIRAQHAIDPYAPQQYATAHYPEIQSPGGSGLRIQYDGFDASTADYDQGDFYAYNGVSYVHQGSRDSSPPTPKSARSDNARRTRSGYAIASSASPKRDTSRGRVTKSPRPRKSKAGKGDKQLTPKLSGPLSELTKDMDVPVRDMEEWVTRPAEVRRKEVEKRNGYVTRPMNSFMLYRSAYAERTKEWCSKNNHQIVSSVSGESWPLEPLEVRERYNEYAKIERINHQKAHPTYKFSPSKTTISPRKRRDDSSDDEDDQGSSDLGDPDVDWAPSSRRMRAKPNKKQGRDTMSPVTINSQDSLQQRFPGSNFAFNKSSWEATNEGKPLPAAMGTADLHRQYYQTTVHRHQYPGIEDVRMVRTETPGMHYGAHQSLIGLPGGYNQELLQVQSHQSAAVPHEPQVDPMLLAYDSGHTNYQLSQGQQPVFTHESHINASYGYGEDQNGLHTYIGGVPMADYHDPYGGQLETGSEFDNGWMES